MIKPKSIYIAILLCLFACKTAQLPSALRLPNGWSISAAGRNQALGDLPLNLVVSPNGQYLLAVCSGQSEHSLQLISSSTEKVLDHYIAPVVWMGAAFEDNETFYVSGGTANKIYKYKIKNDKIVFDSNIDLGDEYPEIWPAGIAIDRVNKLLYVVTKENNSLYIIDLHREVVLHRSYLGAEGYTCVLSPDAKILYISLWGDSKIVYYDTYSRQIIHKMNVGEHPNDLVINKTGNLLFVANANDNSVSVIDLVSRKTIETLNASLYPESVTGSGTNGVALSEDESTLYIANADNNCLTVFDITIPGSSHSNGFIPVGWYPTSVKVLNQKIWVTNGKGFQSRANPDGPDPINARQNVKYQQGDTAKQIEVEYIGGLFKGTLSIIDMPDHKTLVQYTKRVYDNVPYDKDKELLAEGKAGNPIPRKVGEPSPIKHVFYIIKENRTYDQVLGDMKEGNGDSSLCLFPEPISPNQHALAKEFVLLDNFYVDAEVSADGHNWSTAAYATDYVEKSWPVSYGGRGGTYDFEGTRKLGWPKKGYIWDHCQRAGVSYRTYGEFADDGKANIPALEGHFCPFFTSWDETVKDTTRVSQWIKDFDSLLVINAVPQFNSLRLINDHTEGLRKGRPTPFAHVADNDLAVGLFVEYLSKSKIWQESVVFIIEDDAQNGPDHVDAHRSIAFVAGGWVKRKMVDHTMYSTSSMLRTIELILGIPPMSQYDAAATPMWRCFDTKPNSKGFKSIIPAVNMDEKNIVLNKWQEISETFDLSKEDAVPDILFNEVLWHAVKGDQIPFPGPRRAAFLRSVKAGIDEDDD